MLGTRKGMSAPGLKAQLTIMRFLLLASRAPRPQDVPRCDLTLVQRAILVVESIFDADSRATALCSTRQHWAALPSSTSTHHGQQACMRASPRACLACPAAAVGDQHSPRTREQGTAA